MRKHLLLVLVALPAILILLPALLVRYLPSFLPEAQPPAVHSPQKVSQAKQIPIHLYRTEKKAVETLPIEEYIEGVVSAEMPAEFQVEALKAQALAARTYIVRRLLAGRFEDVPKGAHVLDTVKHQAYLDVEQRKARWGSEYEWKSKRIQEAVAATSGMILTYDGKPIDATFFSTSNGFTENAEEYWNDSIPYLKSVASPWDSESPRFVERVVFTRDEFERKLGVQLDMQAMQGGGGWYDIPEKTTGNRVAKIRIGNKVFSGREFREQLGLNSTSFTLKWNGNLIEITTQGYGHGVGMSQWGANGMAKAGKNAEQIVKYFYQGVSLETYDKVLKS